MPPGTAKPAAAEGAALVISLYRSILRLHKDRLPPQLRSLGDAHARSEFQAHLRGRTTAEQWEQFYQAWRGYLLTLGGSDVQPRVGQLDDGTSQALAAASTTFAANLDKYLTPEQKLRMESLRKEAQQLGGDAIRQQLEGEGSLLRHLQQQQDEEQQQPGGV
uniref:Succinate dehydrogenase assembly factor 3 n=1 Tax=Dunaliella tertiolecta TaxID=3047 RepID=A0A7S3VMP9_DUNTE|mmetsp:Transcript_4893/g.11570  ORF Transcript_4893/g.11570 Transcript_4893/m.11570 type:complete len:162 (+) Transcript_4893:462-947(+)|eukprot:CAMPEP_0202351336 /NCGR_PEP_ID=MMETSP1126-20121109/8024_1 /ASSEMBLY_ACC=CAM_ASM_000457 /TAXON_ID=3047 /ORGANISM="Dunaliella tertiolecta, Strain CCMP1320" /LENGTH=161 /DNA_ID=CAMNT_0048943437 /DNA_START=415 /DNA_END=900 /DNA_ORIENTATION=-